jgi:hypothetical protein
MVKASKVLCMQCKEPMTINRTGLCKQCAARQCKYCGKQLTNQAYRAYTMDINSCSVCARKRRRKDDTGL